MSESGQTLVRGVQSLFWEADGYGTRQKQAALRGEWPGGDDRPAGEKGSLVRMGLGGEASCGRRAEPLPSRGSEVVEMTFQNEPRVVSSWKVCASKEEALSWMRGVVTPSSWKVCARKSRTGSAR